MRALAWMLAVLVVLLDVAGWAFTFALAWAASAPNHDTEAARCYLVGSFSFFGLLVVLGAVVLVVNVEENR